MRKTLWSVALLTGLLSGGVAVVNAVAQPGEHGHGPIGELMARMHQAHAGRHAALHAELNLTEEQRTALHETLKAHHADIAAVLRPVIAAKHSLHAAVLADTPDDAAIRDAAGNLGESLGDAAVVIAKIKVELLRNAQFTPEQIKKLEEFKTGADAEIDAFLDELEKLHS
jgi:Spy/CpxP family protein refolding chaperone